MNKGIIAAVLLAVGMQAQAAYSVQVSYTDNMWLNETETYRAHNDYGFQISIEKDDNYLFLANRMVKSTPTFYHGADFNMVGVGLGRYWNKDGWRMFAQAGYYEVTNNFGYRPGYNELYSYYLMDRFKDATSNRDPRPWSGFEVENENTYSVQIGADIPINKYMGVKVHYEYMRMHETIWGYRAAFPDRYKVNCWMDENNRDLSNIGIGVYIKY